VQSCKSYAGHEHDHMFEVLEVQTLMPQPHHRQHSRFLLSSSMAMDLAHVGCVAGVLVGYTVVSHGAEGILVYGHFCTDMTATFAQIYVTSGAEINITDAARRKGLF
jgi:hypothetical protein